MAARRHRGRSTATPIVVVDPGRIGVLPVTIQEIQAFNAENVPFSAMMNITCDSIDDGVAIGRFAYDPRWTRPVDSTLIGISWRN